MKMYTFGEGGYCESYHVVAHTKEEALNYIKNYCIEQDTKTLKDRIQWWSENKNFEFPVRYKSPNGVIYRFENLEDYLTKGGYAYKNYLKYTNPDFVVEERGVGEVLETEVS